jgi:hypothetical protein
VRRVVALVALVALLAGCDSASKADAPEPAPADIVNGTHTQVIKMPDGFRNLAFTCYGTTGIYVTSRGWIQDSASKELTPLPSSIAVLANDPKC